MRGEMPVFEGITAAEKTAVVIDIGAAYTKCGFASETGPRSIVKSIVKMRDSGKVVKLSNCSADLELYEALRDFLHIIYFKHLLVNPKERRVVICDSVFTPISFRQTLASVLFDHFEVPSVLMAPSHLLALFTVGSSHGLVIDCGFSETVVLPIYEGIPLLTAAESLPVGAKAIHDQLEALLLEHGRIHVAKEDGTIKPLSSVLSKLDEKVVEDIKVRTCFVTNMERSKQIQSNDISEQASEYTPPPDVDYPVGGDRLILVPGRIRETVAELMFQIDYEEKSIATIVLDSVIKCPIDLRRTMIENLIVIGGTAMMPGFKHRLLAEVRAALKREPYCNKLPLKIVKIHESPSLENCTAWLGGAIFGAADILSTRSIPRESFLKSRILPDWFHFNGNYNSDSYEPQRTFSLGNIKP